MYPSCPGGLKLKCCRHPRGERADCRPRCSSGSSHSPVSRGVQQHAHKGQVAGPVRRTRHKAERLREPKSRRRSHRHRARRIRRLAGSGIDNAAIYLADHIVICVGEQYGLVAETATAPGVSSEALLAGPPSPLKPWLALPATVFTSPPLMSAKSGCCHCRPGTRDWMNHMVISRGPGQFDCGGRAFAVVTFHARSGQRGNIAVGPGHLAPPGCAVRRRRDQTRRRLPRHWANQGLPRRWPCPDLPLSYACCS